MIEFSDETINKYKKYFELPNVTKAANDIKNAATSISNLKTEEEAFASIVLSYIMFKEDTKKRTRY